MNNSSTKKIINFAIIFLIVLYKFMLSWGIENNKILYTMIVGIFFFSIISIVNDKFNKTNFFKIILLLMFGFFSMYKLVSVNFIFPILIAITHYNDDSKKIINKFLICLLIGFIGTIILNRLGILNSHNLIRYKEGFIQRRYSLGFIHPGFVGLYVTFIILAYYYLHKVSIHKTIITVGFIALFYYLSDSRIALITQIIFLFLYHVRIKNIEKIIKKLLPYMFIIFTVITLVSIKLYNLYNLEFLDKIFSKRLSIYYEYVTTTNLLNSPFGIGLQSMALDNYYLAVFLYFGYIGYILWTIFNISSLKKMKKDYMLSIIQFIIFIYGLADANVIVTSINFMITIQVLETIKLNSKTDKKEMYEKGVAYEEGYDISNNTYI